MRQNGQTHFHQAVHLLLQFPDFPVGAAAVRRRVHDDAVVHIAAPLLALHKFFTVVHQPAHRTARKAGNLRVLPRPCHHAARSVHMAHLCARRKAGERSRARVAEQVQHLHRPPRRADLRLREVPVNGLLGEQPRVLKPHCFQSERQPAARNLPDGRHGF